MELNKQKFALAAAGTMGVAYLICAAFVALWADFGFQLLGWLVHVVNVDKFAGDVAMTFTGLIWGLVQAVIYTYIGAWLFGWLHNRFQR